MPSVTAKHKTPARPQPTDHAFRELIRVFGLAERVMQPYFAQFGISGAQWGVLRNLHRAEQEGLAGLRLTELSERLLVRPASVTGVIDRLEKAGFVRRVKDPGDRRRVVIEPFPERIEREIAPLFESLAPALAELCARYGTRELAAVRDFIAGVQQIAYDQIRKMRGTEGEAKPAKGSRRTPSA